MYNRLKRRTYEIVQPDAGGDVASAIFDWSIIVLICANVLLVILDTFQGFSAQTLAAFRTIETVSVIIFSVEYIIRLWTAPLIFPELSPLKARLKYAFSFMALVDILAILPFYVPFIIPVDLRVLRMVRLLRLLRILKVNRYTNALYAVGDVMRRKAAQLLSSMFVVIVLMIMSSVLMYNLEAEAQPDIFQNAFSGFWWAIATLTTVGYGDIYPVTMLGKILSAVIALLGIGLIAVPTGIISAGFVKNINGEKSTDSKCFCPYCGKKIDD